MNETNLIDKLNKTIKTSCVRSDFTKEHFHRKLKV